MLDILRESSLTSADNKYIRKLKSWFTEFGKLSVEKTEFIEYFCIKNSDSVLFFPQTFKKDLIVWTFNNVMNPAWEIGALKTSK